MYVEKVHPQTNWLFLLGELIREIIPPFFFNILLVLLKAVDCRKPHSHIYSLY